MIFWHTQFSWARTVADLENEELQQHINQMVDLMEVLRQGGRPKEPAFYMWHKHISAFMIAGMVACNELVLNRRLETKKFWIFMRAYESLKDKGNWSYEIPPWFTDADLCRSHRSVLMVLRPASYDLELWPGTPKQMPLLWPVVSDDGAVADLRVAKADLGRLRNGELRIPKSIRSRVVNL